MHLVCSIVKQSGILFKKAGGLTYKPCKGEELELFNSKSSPEDGEHCWFCLRTHKNKAKGKNYRSQLITKRTNKLLASLSFLNLVFNHTNICLIYFN